MICWAHTSQYCWRLCLYWSWQRSTAEVVGHKGYARQLCFYWNRSEWSRLSSHLCQSLSVLCVLSLPNFNGNSNFVCDD